MKLFVIPNHSKNSLSASGFSFIASLYLSIYFFSSQCVDAFPTLAGKHDKKPILPCSRLLPVSEPPHNCNGDVSLA